MSLLLKHARVVDPSQGLDDLRDLVIQGETVAKLVSSLGPQDFPDCEVLDLTGLVLVPGLIDLHAHLREPGREDEETVETGTRAAVAGGFTAVCCMPNTQPVTDNQAAVGFLLSQARRAGYARVYPVPAATIRSEGKEMTEIGDLAAAGAVGVTDDGRPIHSPRMMRRLLEYTQAFDLPVVNHCEEPSLSDGGVMNEGLIATRLGLRGIPAAAESIMVARDIALAELTGGRLHLAHLSTPKAVELVREAKRRGVRVTAEVTPHHLVLSEEAVLGYETRAKVNPPLRDRAQVEALREGLADGTLDCIATDHAPHHYDEKEQDFNEAPFGMIGLETALGLMLTELVGKGCLTLSQLIERMSTAPARIFHLPGGTLAEGALADLTIVDLTREWTVDRQAFQSKSWNTPFEGWRLKGRVMLTVVGGRIVWQDPDFKG